MIEIIPNWHPIFVHFTLGLFSIAVLFYVLVYLASSTKWKSATIFVEFEIAARWCLWMSGLLIIPTVAMGFYAYYTVAHDAPSHIAMVIHRNWALPTAIAIFLTACWSLWRYLKLIKLTWTFTVVLLIVQCLLLITAWHGAELVFRYGIGVISLPQQEEMEHHH